MIMCFTRWKILMCVVSVSIVQQQGSESIRWERIPCAVDAEERLADGYLADVGRFPWLGLLQHDFYVGGEVRYAVTSGILIHPAYAIAPADDVAKIPFEHLANRTRLVVWASAETRYALGVREYVLHPEYRAGVTRASLALLHLRTRGETSPQHKPKPVLPVCLPTREFGTLTDLYAVRVTDARGKLEKEAFSMDFMDNKDCEEFYYKNGLRSRQHAPVSATCAVRVRAGPAAPAPAPAPCVWEAGAALLSRQAWGHWKLLGVSARGAGCGAPARFLNLYAYLGWIDDLVTPLPVERLHDLHTLALRRLSPVKIMLYTAKKIIPKEQGQCERDKRGRVMYKDSAKVVTNKMFGQGFFFVVVHDIASFTCAVVDMPETTVRSNAAMWLEHYCPRDLLGTPHAQDKPRDYRRQECFVYFKSAAFLEFRFYFSHSALVSATVYGVPQRPRLVPDPFRVEQTTAAWWPTSRLIQWGSFEPYLDFWADFYTK